MLGGAANEARQIAGLGTPDGMAKVMVLEFRRCRVCERHDIHQVRFARKSPNASRGG